jgi:hypothetical protein
LVNLYIDTSNKLPCKLHRLLAITFLPNPEKYNSVDHINADKLDNSLSNLRWCSYSTNTKNWCDNRTNFRKVIQYTKKGEEIAIWNSASEAATELGFNVNAIFGCCNPNLDVKTHMGFVWIYADPAHRIPKKDIDYNDYTLIGMIGDLNFPDFWIKNDGSKIVDNNNNVVAQDVTGGYKRCILVSDTNVKKHLAIHKIINQIFLEGKYNDVVGHLDGDKLNNNFTNLKVMSLHLFPFKMAKIFFVIKLIYIFYFSTCNILLSFFVI